MKIKKGDKVQMLTGKDKGKTGKVLQILANRERVVVEGLNLLVKNTRPKRHGEKGQQVQFPAAIHISNVILICPKCGAKTRVAYKLAEQNAKDKVQLKSKKFRQCKKCKQPLD
jgi:large subunit ribosomal protein L24